MFVRVHGQSCGGIGTSSGELVPNRTQGFYLNIQDPAPCNGTIDEFQYCYYHTEQDGADSYIFTTALFRETSPGIYRRVTSAHMANRNSDNIGSQPFTCVSVNTVVKVQVGDVIGACIFGFEGEGFSTRVDQLDLVGQDSSPESDRYLMMADVSRCRDFFLANNPVVVSSLSRVNYLVLHIFANIGKPEIYLVHIDKYYRALVCDVCEASMCHYHQSLYKITESAHHILAIQGSLQ